MFYQLRAFAFSVMVSCLRNCLTCRKPAINHNGPAIKGGCVTRRKHRAVPIAIGTWYFSRETVTVQGGMAHFLPSRYKVLWALRVSRYKFDRSCELIPGYKVGGGYWRSVAIQFWSEPEIYHGARFKLRADARVRVQQPLQICLECRSKAKSVTNNLPILSVLAVAKY